MKKLVLISLLFTSAAMAEDVKWTSDTTYVKGGVEYVDPIEIGRKIVNEWLWDESTGVPTEGDIQGAEYDMNPSNPKADTWMYRQSADVV